MIKLAGLAAALATLALAACSTASNRPVSAGYGPDPALPKADAALIPTVNVARAAGWPADLHPRAADGLQVRPFSTGLDHPRWLYVLPNGDVLVAETNAPPRPDDSAGFKGWIASLLMRRAGAGVPSADRITLLRDANGDGVVDQRTTFLEHLHSPFGMALIGNIFYVADTDAILAFPYRDGETQIDAPPSTLVELPAGPRNHHWTKNLLASPDGRTLYVTVGSNSNAAENGMEAEQQRAAIWAVDVASGAHQLYATGLRNPNGMAWQPDSGALWTVVNERDEIGNDLVPDYMTSVRKGGFYGWPYSYYGTHVDTRVQPQKPDLVARAIVPDYALGAHTASLGLCAAAGNHLPPTYAHGMFVGQHGSWNRKPRSGYKVIFVPFADGQPAGMPRDVLDGFVSDDGQAYGRPVGVALDRTGALLIADDVGNTIWRVTAAPPAATP
ncbi:PQQ-dependent sugar dehydrogenase [Solimonas marina]|uniref:Sorbosone dehydrogenase family protein n=1 Tax=Solimonas marina TaxID=2714601 RepID=A0A970B6L3_9GAMM|nr:sorbosone dehydrogenase family protein [Solimonas marina]NKF24607.1 sorbosone dehydrogenase family protein [Solimonas marina]